MTHSVATGEAPLFSKPLSHGLHAMFRVVQSTTSRSRLNDKGEPTRTRTGKAAINRIAAVFGATKPILRAQKMASRRASSLTAADDLATCVHCAAIAEVGR